MNRDAEIERIIQMEDKVIHVHIHLSEKEMRRLLLPHIVDVFASEVRKHTPLYHNVTAGSSTPWGIER